VGNNDISDPKMVLSIAIMCNDLIGLYLVIFYLIDITTVIVESYFYHHLKTNIKYITHNKKARFDQFFTA
jgi:hypothetical protein